MTRMEKSAAFSRRALLKTGGALVVSIGMPISLDTRPRHQRGPGAGRAKPPLTPDQLSSYIAVNADGTVSAFFGKMDMGHGITVAIGQIVAEELDVPFKAVKVYMGDTATSVNQGGASGSTGIQLGGKQMRDGGGRSAPRAGRDGGREARRAGRRAHRGRRRRAGEERPGEEGVLRAN